jgi:type III pantothenate kinase
MHTLCLDFGNSRFKAAVFNNDQFIETIDLLDDTISHLKTIIDAYKPEKTILSSVVHHDTDIENLLIQHTKFHKVSNETILNFKLATGKPETTGVDRLALAAAAVHLFPKKNNRCVQARKINTFISSTSWCRHRKLTYSAYQVS